MKLDATTQYALLFVLYLTRAGRASVPDVAASLGLPLPLLRQVAWRLKNAGIVKAHARRNGGYELLGEPTVGMVLSALGHKDIFEVPLRNGETEHRSLVAYSNSLRSVMKKLLNRKVSNIIKELTANEVAVLDRLQHSEHVN